MEKLNLIVTNATDKYIIGQNKRNTATWGSNYDIAYYPTDNGFSALYNPNIGVGDFVALECIKKNKEPLTITKITEWRVLDMRDRILNIVTESYNLYKESVKEFIRKQGTYELSDSGREKLITDINSRLSAQVETKRRAGKALFDKKIEEVQTAEAADIERRNNNLEYQEMLLKKCNVLRGLDLSQVNENQLRDYIKEFENDPIAINLLGVALKRGVKSGMVTTMAILPADNNGQAEKKLRSYSNDFEKVLYLCSDISGMGRDKTGEVLADNFVLRLQSDNEGLSLPLEEVVENMQKKGGGKIALSFNGVRK